VQAGQEANALMTSRSSTAPGRPTSPSSNPPSSSWSSTAKDRQRSPFVV